MVARQPSEAWALDPILHKDSTETAQKCSESDFIDLHRIDKHGLHFFANKFKNNADLMRSTCAGLPIEGQLLVALRYFATGNSVKSLQNKASLSLSVGAVYKCIARVF